ncbi:MAG: DUF2214 family protein [Cytophagales bacterium]|nr:DUF2214 family protein [Rhizobacter sp.]
MLIKSVVAYAHFISAFGIAATLFFEWYTFSRTPTARDARRLALADRWYGLFSVVLLIAGFSRVIVFEKGFEFYRAGPFFSVKLGLFLVIGLLSIYPTIRFIRWRSDIQAGRAPTVSEAHYKMISRILSLEMILLAMLMLSASLMANGVGAG